jgi:hypothetical protein
MNMSVGVTQETGYLSLKVTGAYSLAAFQAVAKRVMVESAKNNQRNILLDIVEVSGNVPAMDRFFLGEYVSSLWPPAIRVAIVYRATEIDKFFETVAVNRGTQTLVVPDLQTAREWLTKKTAPKPEAGDGT